jgi:hypothetical protein
MFFMDARIERAVDVQKKYTDRLMQNRHVMGVSVRPVNGYVHNPEGYALVVLVDDDDARKLIPKQLEDVPVIVQPIGKVTAQ